MLLICFIECLYVIDSVPKIKDRLKNAKQIWGQPENNKGCRKLQKCLSDFYLKKMNFSFVLRKYPFDFCAAMWNKDCSSPFSICVYVHPLQPVCHALIAPSQPSTSLSLCYFPICVSHFPLCISSFHICIYAFVIFVFVFVIFFLNLLFSFCICHFLICICHLSTKHVSFP